MQDPIPYEPIPRRPPVAVTIVASLGAVFAAAGTLLGCCFCAPFVLPSMAAAEGVAVYPVFSTLWAVVNAVANIWLATVVFRAGNACLRLEEKGRQGMIFYAIAIPSWMGTSLVLYCIFESPSDLTNTPMAGAFLALGYAVAYPAAVLFTMTDERVKRAFVAHAAPAAKPYSSPNDPDEIEFWIDQHRDNPDD